MLERCPEHFKIKKWTQCYLIFETILLIYLLVCLVQIDRLKDHRYDEPYVTYANTCSFFVFICTLPFFAARIISLLCCKSVVGAQWIMYLTLCNLITYAAWCIYVVIVLISESGTMDHFSIDFVNLILGLITFGLSVPIVLIGFPIALTRLCKEVSHD